ncbi:type I-F CRISPR-associated protein Csy2 [Paracoccus jeotgali]|uniref:type I-F CRISPR-associated protein Csy2 n=1 Tax=Paracoccus jeotgali TaxID=2065379 RepID=UPI0028B25E2C|nr:type I-F CRISPR-associated protein Csy2 [Paracoccus jeotgali]
MRFAVCNLRASRVNLLMNDYVAGLPSPTAFLGLAESIGRDLGVEPWAAQVLPILHAVHISEGRTKPEMESKGGAFTPIEIIEDLVGTIDASIILDLPGCEDADALRSRILCKRIAGGTIANRHIRVEVVAKDGGCLNGLRRGYAMVRPDQCERRLISSGDLAQMERIAQILFPAIPEPGRGRIIPVAVGHRLLEDPDRVSKRIRARSPDMPHVFVEPCVGIAELISVRNARLTDLDDDGMADRFWRWSSEGNYILAHPAYHHHAA